MDSRALKRIFVIALFLFLLSGGGLIAYYYMTTPQDAGLDRGQTVDLPAQLPPASLHARGTTPVPVTQTGVLSPVFNQDGNAVLYFDTAGRSFYTMDIETGDSKELGLSLDYVPAKILWSPNRTQALVEKTSGDVTAWHLINFTTHTSLPLKAGLENPVWVSDNQIAYKFYSAATGERTLNLSKPDGSEWRKLTDITLPRLEAVSLPAATQSLFYWNRGNAFENTILQSIDVRYAAPSTLFTEKFGADYLFSPNGSALLVSHTDQKGGHTLTLATLNAQGGEYRSLLVKTLVSKVTWLSDNRRIYYAEPGAWPENAVLPNDYFEKKFATQDAFWQMDIVSGKKMPLLSADVLTSPIDAEALLIHPQETALFFVNRLDGRLYRMDLE